MEKELRIMLIIKGVLKFKACVTYKLDCMLFLYIKEFAMVYGSYYYA